MVFQESLLALSYLYYDDVAAMILNAWTSSRGMRPALYVGIDCYVYSSTLEQRD